MNTFPSSTFFSAPPDWAWLIVLYFFLGGLAGGSYFLAALLDLFGRPEDRPLSRLGYYMSFPCNVISVLLLIGDLRRPERFWHMVIASHTYRPMFKYWSPMSSGSWALMIFGLCAFLSFLSALTEADRLRWPTARHLRPPGPLGGMISVIGGLLGLYIAGYTGVLLAVTNRPIWSDTPLLGMLFIVSAASTSTALLLLLARGSRLTTPGLFALHRMDAWFLVLEIIVLGAVIQSLGPLLHAWLNAWGLLLLLGVIVLGILFPLMLHWRREWLGDLNMPTAAVWVLVGGFLLRMVIVFSAQGV
jgi:formate-dependent nitrite reductase membrane component NrfD